MKKAIIFIIIALAAAEGAFAQQIFRSTYFLEGYNHRHQFNPAFASSTSYFTVPVIGSFNLETQSNMGVSTFSLPCRRKADHIHEFRRSGRRVPGQAES